MDNFINLAQRGYAAYSAAQGQQTSETGGSQSSQQVHQDSNDTLPGRAICPLFCMKWTKTDEGYPLFSQPSRGRRNRK
ncbi:hypothetical protein FRC20_004155 [Serendipita sp. 405]|nr:hypothetical protein FRC20_004155 [Serendipita sp. 405]